MGRSSRNLFRTAVLVALLLSGACSRATLREPLVPGQGTASLKIGETTVDQAMAVLGTREGTARENSSTTTGPTGLRTVYEQLADLTYDDGLTVGFRGESSTSLLGGVNGGTSDTFKAYREKNMGRLSGLEVKATRKGASPVKTDKGLALLDPPGKVQELYGDPVVYLPMMSTREFALFFREGLVVTLGRPPGQKDEGPEVVVAMAVRRPFGPDELRGRPYKHKYKYH